MAPHKGRLGILKITSKCVTFFYGYIKKKSKLFMLFIQKYTVRKQFSNGCKAVNKQIHEFLSIIANSWHVYSKLVISPVCMSANFSVTLDLM